MKKHLLLITAAGIMLMPALLHAQDIHFSQWYNSPLTLNPSLAGSTKNIQAIANYRSPLQSIYTPYKTYALSCDARYTGKKWERGFFGFGVNMFDETTHSETGIDNMQANLSIAYHLYAGKNSMFGGGLQAGLGKKTIHYQVLQWGGAPTFAPITSSYSFTYPDFSGGVSWHYGYGQNTSVPNDVFKANAGIAVFHFNNPRQSFFSHAEDKVYSKYVAHASTEIGIKNIHGVLIPGLFYETQGSSGQLTSGVMVKYLLKEDSKLIRHITGAAIAVGGYYRSFDAFIVASSLEIANYTIGISYDVNTSSLKEASSEMGGFEICLKYVRPNSFKQNTKVTPVIMKI